MLRIATRNLVLKTPTRFVRKTILKCWFQKNQARFPPASGRSTSVSEPTCVNGKRVSTATPIPVSCEKNNSEHASSSKTRKFQGVKVSDLPRGTTAEQVKEHFHSRNFTVGEAAVHTRNSKDSIASVHFKSEEDQRRAICKVDGSFLHGREIKVGPCCCRRIHRDKDYGKKSCTQCSNGSASGSFSYADNASDCTSIETCPSHLSVISLEAPTIVAVPKSESPTIKARAASIIKSANCDAPIISEAPTLSIKAENSEAPTISSIPCSQVPDSKVRCIAEPERNTALTGKAHYFKYTSTPPVGTESINEMTSRTNPESTYNRTIDS